MLITFFVMVVFVMHTIVKTETIDITAGTCSDDMSVVEGDNEILDEIG